MQRDVLIFAEVRGGNVRKVSLECLTAAKQIASGGKVFAALFGTNDSSHTSVLGTYGADHVYTVADEGLQQYNADRYTQAMSDLVTQLKPDVVILGHTGVGKDWAPKFAARHALGMVSDVTSIKVEGDEVYFTRPIYAGKAFQTKKFTAGSGTMVVTIRPNNIDAQDAEASRQVDTSEVSVQVPDLRTVIKDVVHKASGGIDLTEAKIVVSGGRGVKSEDGFAPLKQLAEVLGAAVGASRGACDAGYCDYSLQVGQTGKVVTPDLYIACGISGAIQHIAGMSNSKIIVAINKDPEAPIFQVADYGIVGDLFEVVPLLTEAFKRELQ